jgi:hypothetical protein
LQIPQVRVESSAHLQVCRFFDAPSGIKAIVWLESGGSQHSRPSQVHKQCLTAPFTALGGCREEPKLLVVKRGQPRSPLRGRRRARPEALAGRCGRPCSPAGVDLAPSPWRASAAGLARRARSESPAGKNGRPCSPASSSPRVPGGNRGPPSSPASSAPARAAGLARRRRARPESKP